MNSRKYGRSYVVLEGVGGEVLSFAPGWHSGAVQPGGPGISLIAGHRDTHFAFLQRLSTGDTIRLQNARGRTEEFIVERFYVTEEPEIRIRRSDKDRILLLSTFYPFENSRPGDTMRFVVVARSAGVNV